MGDNEEVGLAEETGDEGTNAVDNEGTSEAEGRALLQKLRDAGFEGSDEKLAIALGRPIEEVEGWMNGTEPVDDDVVMKARGIAKERGIEVE
jgi:hypothetical protein